MSIKNNGDLKILKRPGNITDLIGNGKHNYVWCRQCTEAARRAGYSSKTAKEIGSINLTKVNIKSYIEERLKYIWVNGYKLLDNVGLKSYLKICG